MKILPTTRMIFDETIQLRSGIYQVKLTHIEPVNSLFYRFDFELNNGHKFCTVLGIDDPAMAMDNAATPQMVVTIRRKRFNFVLRPFVTGFMYRLA